MRNVRWSGPFALDDTLSSLLPKQRVAFIDTLSDVDNGEDYRIYQHWLDEKKQSPRLSLQTTDDDQTPDTHAR